MGLESATFISQLDATNPTAGDRKSQGDDHLRLIKAVLQNTFPGASRALQPVVIALKSANYNIVEADNNTTFICDASGGAFNLTLPTPSYPGWCIKVVKQASDTNPVFVFPPSGNINGVDRIRCNVPFIEYIFFWTGGAFLRLRGAGEPEPGTLMSYGGQGTPIGYARPEGQSLLRADYPELFVAWGTSWGSVDGTHFTAPDVRSRFLTQSGGTYAFGATGGENTHTLTIHEMCVHTHGIVQNPHTHAVHSGSTGQLSTGSDAAGGGSPELNGGAVTIDAANADITINNAGDGAEHENRPPYTAMNRIFRLC